MATDTPCPNYEQENPSVIAALLARVSTLENKIAAVERSDAAVSVGCTNQQLYMSIHHNTVTWKINSFRQALIQSEQGTLESGPFNLLGFSFGGIALSPSVLPRGSPDDPQSKLSACLAPLPGTCSILLSGPTDLKLSRIKVSIGSTVHRDFNDLSFSPAKLAIDGMGEALLPSVCRLDEGWERNTDTFTIRICIEEIAHTLSYGLGVTTSACLSKQKDDHASTMPRIVEWHIQQADKVLSGASRSLNSPEFPLPGAKGDIFCLRLVLPDAADHSERQAMCGLYLVRCHSPYLTRQHELAICADFCLSASRPSQEIKKELKGKLTQSLGFEQFCSVSSAFARLSSQRELVFFLALNHISVLTRHDSFFDRDETVGRVYITSCGLSECTEQRTRLTTAPRFAPK